MKKTLKKLIKERNLNWSNPDITEEAFPLSEPRKGEAKVFRFDGYVSSEEAVSRMEKEGCSPATLSDLLSWDGWDGKKWVVALGSVGEVDGDRSVPCLGKDGSKRSLSLHWWDGVWGSGCRFLAVRNSALDASEPLPALGSLDFLTLEAAIGKVKEAGYVIYKQI